MKLSIVVFLRVLVFFVLATSLAAETPDPTTELPILYDAVYLTRGGKTGWVPGPKTGLEVGRFLLLFEFILMWIHRIESVDFSSFFGVALTYVDYQ